MRSSPGTIWASVGATDEQNRFGGEQLISEIPSRICFRYLKEDLASPRALFRPESSSSQSPTTNTTTFAAKTRSVH